MEKLIPGAPAPDFTGYTYRGTPIRLGEYRGRLVWLIFYRYPRCPMCNLHLSALRSRYEFLQQWGLEIIAVFESPPELFPNSMGGKGLPDFPLLSDPTKELYRLYGTEDRVSAAFKPQVGLSLLKAMFLGYPQGKIDGAVGQIPAHFLISQNGHLQTVHYGKHIGDHIPWDTVHAFINRFGSTENRAVGGLQPLL